MATHGSAATNTTMTYVDPASGASRVPKRISVAMPLPIARAATSTSISASW